MLHLPRSCLPSLPPAPPHLHALQETGETLTAAVRSLGDALSSAAAAGDAPLASLLRPSDHKRMFFSVLGRAMVTYSADTANLLHTAPLVLALSAPAALKLLHPATVRDSWQTLVQNRALCCVAGATLALPCCQLSECAARTRCLLCSMRPGAAAAGGPAGDGVRRWRRHRDAGVGAAAASRVWRPARVAQR